MTVPPSGEQFAIAAGDQRATIVEVGGGIRAYQVADCAPNAFRTGEGLLRLAPGESARASWGVMLS